MSDQAKYSDKDKHAESEGVYEVNYLEKHRTRGRTKSPMGCMT